MNGVPDLLRVARELRLKVKEEDLEGCEGVLLRPKGVQRGIIAVKKTIRSEGRKRFTIAHEIGHYILPGHDEHGSICKPADIESWSESAADRERQANDFAAALLIPESVVISHEGRTPPSFKTIENIANECTASLSASAWRYCDITGEQCAVVWSEEGKVVWSYTSPTFPFFIRKGKLIEEASFAYDCFRGENVPSTPEPVAAEAWIESPNLIPGSRIHEESRSLPSYDSVLTLLVVRERLEKKSDYNDEEEQPLDPNEFTINRKRWPG